MFSSRNTIVSEPFPTFFLKKQEMRSKRGFLDNIKEMQVTGKNISEAKKIDEKNKDVDRLMKIFNYFPSPSEMLKKSTDEESLREYITTVCKDKQEALDAYKLLGYIFATNRTTIKMLKADEKVPMPVPE